MNVGRGRHTVCIFQHTFDKNTNFQDYKKKLYLPMGKLKLTAVANELDPYDCMKNRPEGFL